VDHFKICSCDLPKENEKNCEKTSHMTDSECGYYSLQALVDILFYWGKGFKCYVETVLCVGTGRVFPVLN
jgi:hypothetical protein